MTFPCPPARPEPAHANFAAHHRCDPAGRLTGVRDNVLGDHAYAYAPTEPDIRRQWDGRTAGVLIDQRRAAGSLMSLAAARYARPAGSPWQAIAWRAGLGMYDLADAAGPAAPAALRDSADQRRRLADALATGAQRQRHFDKASNSFFLPPEYATANCEFEDCWIGAMGIDLASPIYAQQEAPVSAMVYSAGAGCYSIIYTLWANGDYIGTAFGGWTGEFDWTPEAAGTFQLEVRAECGCTYAASTIWEEVEVTACTEPYQWHSNNAYLSGNYFELQKTGTIVDGEIEISVDVYTNSQNLFNDFETWIESVWERTVSGSGLSISFTLTLNRVPFPEIADVRVVRKFVSPPPPGSTSTYEDCGLYETNETPHKLTIFHDGDDPAGCSEPFVASHELGHHFGFEDAWLKPYPNTKHCDSTDIMSWGKQVRDYHAQVLWEKH